jgi:hypothetical protein
MSPGEIVSQAECEGYSRMTVYRARRRLGDAIANTRDRHHPCNQWTLRESNVT